MASKYLVLLIDFKAMHDQWMHLSLTDWQDVELAAVNQAILSLTGQASLNNIKVEQSESRTENKTAET